jgi:GT2 family glycosyltransferase
VKRLSILGVLRDVWQLPDTRDVTMSVHVGDRNPQSRGMRYIVKRGGEPLCCVKRLPISGPFDLQALLATQKAYRSLSVVKAPRVVGWVQDDQSFFIVEEFVDGTRLDDAVWRGKFPAVVAQELVTNIFREVYSKRTGEVDPTVERKRVISAVERSDLSARQREKMLGRVLDAAGLFHAPVWTNGDIIPQNVLLSGNEAYLVDFDLSRKSGLLGIDLMRAEVYTTWRLAFWPGEGLRRDDELTELLFLLLEQSLQSTIASEGHYQKWRKSHAERIAQLAERILGSVESNGCEKQGKREARFPPRCSASEPILPVANIGTVSSAADVAWGLKQRLKSSVKRLATMRPGLGALARDAFEGRFGNDSDWRSAGSGEFQYWIEAPGQWSLPERTTMVSGWCFSQHGPIEAIRAVVNGEVCDGVYGGNRPDVKAAMNVELSATNVGFTVKCPVRWGYNDVVLEARREDRWIPVSRALRRAAYFPLVVPQTLTSYQEYLAMENQVLAERSGEYAARSTAFGVRPVISVVIPVFRTDPALLMRAVESVRRQIYDRWELCLVDDASESEGVTRALSTLGGDARVKVRIRTSRGNISAATNDGIAMAEGEWIAFLDHDDELAPEALFRVVEAINRKPECDVIYTDQDKIGVDQNRWEPFFKPDWSPGYLRGVMYVGHLMVARAGILREAGGCDSRFDGVQDFELVLRLSERTKRFEHIPRVLYHWRAISGSVAADGGAKPGIDELQKKAVQGHLDRLGIAAAAQRGSGHRVKLVPRRREIHPKVSILIPTRDHPELIERCLKTLFHVTAYPNFEVLIGDNETRDGKALAILDAYPVKKIPLAGSFHFARFNNILAAQAAGEYLMLLNNDTEIVQADWLDQLLLWAEEEDAGAVGPLLTYADGTVQHAGIIVGPRGTADHVMRGFPGDCDGYMGSLACPREVTAVTAAAMLVHRMKFQRLGGLCERYYRHYDDLDFCLRLRERGLRNVCVTTARLVHHESQSRGDKYDFTDRVLLLDQWESMMDMGDAYYNPNFERNATDYRVGSGGIRG